MANTNVDLVRKCYAYFQAGDLDGLIGRMASDVDWEIVGRRTDLPDFGSWPGVEAVRTFFGTVAETLQFHAFAPREFHPSGDMVFVLGSYDVTVRKTGRRVSSQWLHAFWVKDNRIARFREFTDTARFAEAWRP
jgi:ketosteroid isomerase-like protein